MDLDRGVRAGLVDVVVLEEHGGRQDDVGHGRGVGQELLVHGDEQIGPREAAVHLAELGGDAHRVGVLDQQRVDRAAALQRLGLAGQDRADPRLVQRADRRIAGVQALDHRLVPPVQLAEIVERTAARMLPGAGHHGQAGRGVHGRGTVARAGEAVADAQEGPPGAAIEPGEGQDLGLGQAGDGGSPGGRAGAQVALQLVRHVAVAGEIVPVREALLEQDVHDAAGERTVRARAQGQMQVGLLGRGGAVGVDHHELGAALLPGTGDVGHQVDVGVDRVGAPDHDQIGVLGDLGRRHAPAPPVAGLEAGVGEHDADGALEARVALDVGQPLDAVALHQAHGPGIPVGPDRLGTVALLDAQQVGGDLVQRVVPGDPPEVSRALLAGALQGEAQPVGMVVALLVAGDLGADHARGERVALRAPDLAEPAVGQPLDLERAHRRAVVRADGGVEGHRPLRLAGKAGT